MPASSKMLKNKQQKANREAGIGDADGRIPSRVKAEEVNGICQKCFTAIRMTAKNVEALQHCNSKHAGNTFAECFPGANDPTVVVEVVVDARAEAAAAAAPAVKAAAPKKKKEDLSFLDAGIAKKK